MGCAFSHTVRTFRPLLSEDHHDPVQVDEKKNKRRLLSRLRKTTVKFKKMESKTSLYLPCGCQTKPAKKSSATPTMEDAIRLRDKELLLNIMFNSEDDTGWATLDIKKRNPEKSNPVLLACQLGYRDMVEIFLDNGCSPNLPTKTGRLIHTVLESMKSSNLEIDEGILLLDTLLKKGCDVNIKDNKGTTTLLYCSELGDKQTMELIFPHVAESQFITRCGGSLYTPLHMSVMKHDLHIIKLLLSYKPKRHVNIQDSVGNTPLMLSLQSMMHTCSGRYETNTGTSTNNTSDIFVFCHNMISIVETLLNSGADPNISKFSKNTYINISNFEWNTPLALALQLTVNNMEPTKQIPIGVINKLCTNYASKSMTSTPVNHSSDLLPCIAEESIEDGSVSNSRDNLVTLLTSECEEDTQCLSPFAGVVRLLIQSGASLEGISKEEICQHYPSVVSLIKEIYEYRDKQECEKPARLLHLTKQVIRQHLGTMKKLHLIGSLPLPNRVIDYVGLKTL